MNRNNSISKEILRKISSKDRFIEIVESMRNPECQWIKEGNMQVAIARNKNGICIYGYRPTKEELPEFEFRFNPYVERTEIGKD